MRRKILAIILSTAMVLSLAGCGSKEPAEESTKTAQEIKEEQIKAEIEDEATEGAVEALVEEVIGETNSESDTRIKKVDDVPKELWDACVASAEKRIEEISDYEYRLAAANVSGWTIDNNDNTLTLLYEFDMGDGTVKYASLIFLHIHTETVEEASSCWTMELHFVDTIEEHYSDTSEERIIFDKKVFN